MYQVPAFCDNCNFIFPSGIVIGNSTNVTMTGNKSQCPNCNYMARIPDGIFKFYDGVIEVLQASESTKRDLQKFYTIIQKANKVEATPQKVQQEIQKEVPKLSFLAKYLPQNAKQLIGFIGAIGTLIGGTGGNIEISPHIEINKTEINQNQYFNGEQPYQQIAPALEVKTPFESTNSKIGRNEQCPCESGLKFKYCHGK
ncbi:hypothetical protein FC682_02025 [Peribacillus simplex]|uniref:SEC-C metal-binding domain-containing protein n=1 Tax=Peribacillus simplex TaxID=1478 RepID=UPI0010BE254A|nr:SEC-C metal-binding domain-containing protein [Peribacillus simplex]TKH07327.1 hypothetical protein FC682_02025 [Peribacillus simplex]